MQSSENLCVTPMISSDRITLRGWQDRDFQPYVELVSNPDLMRFIGGGAMDQKGARLEFENMRKQWTDRQIGIFVVADISSDIFLGFSGLFESELLVEPALCWSLSANSHGNGYASEAAILARDWAFRKKKVGPLMSLVHPDNLSSRRVAERLNAVVESTSTWMNQPRLVYRHI